MAEKSGAEKERQRASRPEDAGERRGGVLRGFFSALLLGALAGGFDLLLDLAATAATLGFRLPIEPWHAAAYTLAGAAVGLVLTLGGWWRPRPALLVTTVVGVLQVAALVERIHHVIVARAPWPAMILAAAVLIAGFLLWTHLLRRLLDGQGAGGNATAWALALAALTSSAGLALNRNVVADVLSREAILADLAVVAAVAAVAWLLGRAGRLRPLVALVVLALVVAGSAWMHRPPSPSDPRVDAELADSPHLILVVIDTLRRDVFEAVLAETEEGRRFQQALGGAAYFDRAVAAAPWTAPSVASIMTGLWPPEHGYGYQEKFSRHLPLTKLSPSVRTLAEKLSARGYATSAWVANPVLGAASGLDRGFERFELLNGATSKLPLLTVLERLGFFAQDLYLDAAAVKERVRSHLPSMARDPRPHFLWIHLMDPHLPLKKHPHLTPDPAAPAPRAGAARERLYRDEVRFALDETASMIELLERFGLFEEAVLAVVSDHGEMFPSDGHARIPPDKPKTYGHGHALYGELVHIPLILRPPGGLDEARRVDALTSHVDLLSTFEDLLDLDLRQSAEDRYSLAGWLEREPAAEKPARPFALLGANHIDHPQRGLQGDGHKLILYERRKLGPELFDLEADPGEQENLAASEIERHEQMTRLLELAWSALEKAERGEAVELDEETREQLRALGYLD